MTTGPLGGPRPLSTASMEIELRFVESTDQGRRVIKEVFDKVGLSVDVEQIDDRTYTVYPDNDPVEKSQLDRAHRQFVHFTTSSGDQVGSMSGGRFNGVSMEIKVR